MLFNFDEWEELYKPEQGKLHAVLRHKGSDEKKFMKALRGNDTNRSYELLSELVAANTFSKLDIGVLDPSPELKDGRPVIVMRFVEDAKILNFVENQPLRDQIANKERFATTLFLGDVLINNTNRSKDKLAHIGWERRNDGKIYLLPLDNGHTLGYSNDSALDNDDDLNGDITTRFNNHFSSLLIQGLPIDIAKEILVLIDQIKFEEICDQVKGLIKTTLAPTEEESNNIEQRIDKVKTMLIRRKPQFISKIKQWLNISP